VTEPKDKLPPRLSIRSRIKNEGDQFEINEYLSTIELEQILRERDEILMRIRSHVGDMHDLRPYQEERQKDALKLLDELLKHKTVGEWGGDNG